MKAYGFTTPFSENDRIYVRELDQPMPASGERDLLVEIKSVATNPVDTKVRVRVEATAENPKILGYDASGIVREAGSKTSRFKAGDEVFYAGDITRPGTFGEFHLVDERIVGHKPKSLSFADAAALPLTSITAWEFLFDRFGIQRGGDAKGVLLVIGGAGGVGSIMIQIARDLTNLTVIATASRPETIEWCTKMGAHHVIDHTAPMQPQLNKLGIDAVDMAAGLTRTDLHYKAIVEMMKPGGRIGVIDDPGAMDVALMKPKSLSFHWEFMFTRSMFQTEDMIEQGNLLEEVSKLVDAGTLMTTATRNFGPVSEQNLNEALRYQASGTAIGKSVLG